MNFKTKRKSFKNKKQWIQSKEDWAVFEGTQEAIIDKETFETVQKMRGTKRAYTKFNEVNIFVQRIAKRRKIFVPNTPLR